ncbi:MAG TPA: PDC sensor domain-containing protein, partial [Spirochaetia bacterium]|nr:PDC sensor domain-containing protein [Spirochaetia bacterium]
MRSRTNFRTYVLFGNLVLILLPVILIAVWSVIGYKTVIVRSVRRSNELVATAIAGRLDEFFARSRDAADRIAQLLSRPSLYPRDRLNEYLESILSSWSFFEDIEIIDSGGIIRWLAPFDKEFAGMSRAGDTVFESVLKSPGTYWSTTYMSLKNNEPALTFGRKSNGYVILCGL